MPRITRSLHSSTGVGYPQAAAQRQFRKKFRKECRKKRSALRLPSSQLFLPTFLPTFFSRRNVATFPTFATFQLFTFSLFPNFADSQTSQLGQLCRLCSYFPIQLYSTPDRAIGKRPCNPLVGAWCGAVCGAGAQLTLGSATERTEKHPYRQTDTERVSGQV